MSKIVVTFILLAVGLFLLRYSRAKRQSLRSRRRKIIEQMRLRMEEADAQRTDRPDEPENSK